MISYGTFPKYTVLEGTEDNKLEFGSADVLLILLVPFVVDVEPEVVIAVAAAVGLVVAETIEAEVAEGDTDDKCCCCCCCC